MIGVKKTVLMIAALCLFLPFTGCEKRSKPLRAGMPAPDFTLVDRSGKRWTLSELRGQVVFVNFWATWCPPCREEMPSMQKLHTMLPKEKFKMLAILCQDDPAKADLFTAGNGLTMPILHDGDDSVARRYGLTGFPETFIVDKQGVIREKIIGAAPWSSPGYVAMLMKYIER